MRRSESCEVPNGLTEFIVVETIEHLRDRGLGRARAELRDVPRGARERSRRPLRAPRAEVVPRADERLDADRVAVDVQREVPTRVAPALRGATTRPSTCSARRSRSRARSRSSSCRSSGGSSQPPSGRSEGDGCAGRDGGALRGVTGSGLRPRSRTRSRRRSSSTSPRRARTTG